MDHPSKTPFSSLASVLLLALAVSGCGNPRPLHGGHAATTGPIKQTLAQGDNPSAPSRQSQTTIRTRTYSLPASALRDPGSTLSGPASPSFSLLPSVVSESEETRATTELGAAQKDTAREIGAKLSSLKGIVWVGLGLFLFGLATIFWAPLRVIIGSLTTSLAITLGGLALMVLPTLIVGNELLILAGVTTLVAAWFLAHRHGELRGQLRSQAHPPLHHSTTPSIPSSSELRAAGEKHPTT